MPTRTLRLRLLRSHESGARRRDPCDCPLARLIRPHLKGVRYLGVFSSSLAFCPEGQSRWRWVALPADVARYVAEYDDPDRTHPARLPAPFALELPVEYLHVKTESSRES